MTLYLTDCQTEALKSFFENDFLPYIQSDESVVDSPVWVANMFGVYNKIREEIERKNEYEKLAARESEASADDGEA